MHVPALPYPCLRTGQAQGRLIFPSPCTLCNMNKTCFDFQFTHTGQAKNLSFSLCTRTGRAKEILVFQRLRKWQGKQSVLSQFHTIAS